MTDRATTATLRDLGRIAKLADAITEERRWCDGLGYVRRKRSDTGSGSARGVSDIGDTLCTCPDGDKPVDRNRPEIEGQRSDQRKCGPCAARDQVATADKFVADARALLAGAEKLYGKALASTDRGHAPRPIEFRPTGVRAVSNADMREAKRAQERRRARGEGYG